MIKTSIKDKLRSLWNYFSTYEKIWFISILVLSFVFAFLFPEEDTNGINGKIIMVLYLCDILFNVLCELLISKQSKWNFIVSLLVEIVEIATCVVLAYRFATMAVTLFFWIPIDIISFINWHKHPDEYEKELTEVKQLSLKMRVLVLLLVAVWTICVGYFLTSLDFGTDFFHGNRNIEVLVCYLDACLSALGIANGVFIFLRIKEQWLVWFIYAIIESVINIVTGQVVLLVLKAGYLSNSIYGFIKWSKYIKTRNEGA